MNHGEDEKKKPADLSSIREPVPADAWKDLKKFTAARIALGSTGVSVPIREVLQFRLAHAHARDAVFSRIDGERILFSLSEMGLSGVMLKSLAKDRSEYLQRPDLGRRLDENAVRVLEELAGEPADVAIVIADGLSADAANSHAIPLLGLLLAEMRSLQLRPGPVAVVSQGRVAIGDEIGECLKARLLLMMIGERPGLSAPDSLGVYLTFAPGRGLTDESRNCVSNIRPEGLDYAVAAGKIAYLVREAFRLGLTGVALKDQSAGLPG